MTRRSFKTTASVAAFAAILIAGMVNSPPRLQAQESNEALLIQKGFALAPVPLNMSGKDQNLVGLGSYLVNAVGDCNGCHTAGGPPNFNYAAGRNPYFGQPKMTDPTVYLSGGSNFGPVGTPTGPSGYAGPFMIARNLTPNYAGLPEGGHTLSQFKQIMKTGIDFDHIHPTCTAAQLTAIAGGATPVCIPTGPGNHPEGILLQVMPWPTFQNMSDHDLDAIYEYLSAIPCIDNTTSMPPAGAANELRNQCTAPTTAPAAVPADAAAARSSMALRAHSQQKQ
jgi:mono/diheme cytochrome c family protein